MKTNTSTRREPTHTHEGARAQHVNAEQMLRRSVMACMLFEGEFYEDGEEISQRIASLIPKTQAGKVAAMAVEAREKMKLRHVPLFVVREMARTVSHKALVASTLERVIQRPDELAEFLAIYWKDKRQPLSAQVKKGLARAFVKFNAYSLAKYDQDKAVKLRDVLFLCHAKPGTKAQDETWKKLIDGTLESPDTWEVALSASKGEKKKEHWSRLLMEEKLGGLAFIRNFRNMREAGVERSLVKEYSQKVLLDRVLPFRFIAAARACPEWEDLLEPMFLSVAASQPKLPGKTVLVVDVSGSMYGLGNVSRHSDMTRVDVAAALAALVREVTEESAIYATAGNDSTRVHATAPVPSRRGFALADLFSSQGFASTLGGGGIFLVQCMEFVKEREKTADRVIVLTDEQDCDLKLTPAKAEAFGKENYLVNIASNRNGIGYGKWTHIDGWSEAILDYIGASETQQ